MLTTGGEPVPEGESACGARRACSIHIFDKIAWYALAGHDRVPSDTRILHRNDMLNLFAQVTAFRCFAPSKNSEKQRRNSRLPRCSFASMIVGGPGFLPKTRCRRLIVCYGEQPEQRKARRSYCLDSIA
jgi:hypothetical protein